MLTTATLEKTLSLLDAGHTFASIMEETGIALEDVEIVHVAWFRGTTEQLFRELQLAGVLELVAAKLRSGQGLDKNTEGDVLREVLHAYREPVKKSNVNMRRVRPFDLQPAPVFVDVFLHGLQPFTLEMLREATGLGLKPFGLDFAGDDDSIVILRFSRKLFHELRNEKS